MARLVALREKPTRLVLGLISGTSADGVDAAIVEIGGHGDDTTARLVASISHPLPLALAQRVWALADDYRVDQRGGAVPVRRAGERAALLCTLNFDIGDVFADAALAVIEAAALRPEDIDLCGSHGATARHEPPIGRGARGSTLQIGEASLIAERTGIAVISDFRVADVAAGGHGAPLIPLVDYLLFRRPGERQCLLNLGGIANVSFVGDDLSALVAFDTGPANMALDAVARAASGGAEGYDKDGRRAARGRVDEALLAELLAHPYLAEAPPKSTGRELFGRDFVRPLIDRYSDRLDDLMATLARLTADSVADAVERWGSGDPPLSRLLASGGGVHNPVVMGRIAERLAPLPVGSTAEAGVDPDAKEAVGFALLANQTLFGAPGNVPSATGARGPRVLGKISLPPSR
ncbi:MAG: anhydro-N-acetylmuramic acid kinase [Myxococcales bacterium]|nr:anhydro-N-acetylmuramic acid kinase [Myxococcales bacterium]